MLQVYKNWLCDSFKLGLPCARLPSPLGFTVKSVCCPEDIGGDFKSAGPTLGDGGELMLATGEGLLGKGPPEGGKLPPTALVGGSELVLEECGIGIIGCWVAWAVEHKRDN